MPAFIPNSQDSVLYEPGQGPITEQVPALDEMGPITAQSVGAAGQPLGGSGQAGQMVMQASAFGTDLVKQGRIRTGLILSGVTPAALSRAKLSRQLREHKPKVAGMAGFVLCYGMTGTQSNASHGSLTITRDKKANVPLDSHGLSLVHHRTPSWCLAVTAQDHN